MFNEKTVINHSEMTNEEDAMVLFFTIGKIKAFLDKELKNTKYYGKFDVRYIDDGMAGDYIDIVYLADEDIVVNLGMDVDFQFSTMMSCCNGMMGDFSNTMDGKQGFTFKELSDFIDKNLNELFKENRIDGVLLNDRRAEIAKNYGEKTKTNKFDTVEIEG